MLVVVVPVIVATLAFAWWYRSSNPRASRTPGESYEGRLEFVVWSIPALTVMLLGGVIWIGSHQLDPRAPIPGKSDPLRVDVVALDWKWLFIYPDHGVAAVNQLVIPVGTPLEFRLTSATVMNSFFVPQLQNRLRVQRQWLWTYFTGQRSSRLIPEPPTIELNHRIGNTY